VRSQLRIPSLTPSHISFKDNNLRPKSFRLESLPLTLSIPLSDLNLRPSSWETVSRMSPGSDSGPAHFAKLCY
jgi:hypothetical protein